jgi:hypothetical protein
VKAPRVWETFFFLFLSKGDIENTGAIFTPRRGHATVPLAAQGLLPFVFPFSDPFQYGKPGSFGVGDGQRLQFSGGIYAGDDFPDRFAAERTLGKWGSVDRPP